MTDQPANTHPPFRPTLLKAWAPLLAMNTVIAVGITLFGHQGLGSNLVYSHCIGLCIATLIDAGRYLLIREWPAHMVRLVGVVPVGVVLGFLGDCLVADRLLGNNALLYWSGAPAKAFGKLHLTLRGRPEKLTVSRLYAHGFKAM